MNLLKCLVMRIIPDYIIENSMAQSVERVDSFLTKLEKKVASKVDDEMALLKRDVPAGNDF